MKLSSLMSSELDTETFNKLPPLHKEVVTDFFKVLDKEDGTVIDKFETAVDKTITPVFFGNIIIGGFLGSTTDAVTGKMWDYEDDVVVTCK